MAKIQAFKALRPQTPYAKEVAALPYDVMNVKEAQEMAQSPSSFLHVSRAEIDLPENTPIHSQEVYEKAAANFNQLIQNKILIQDEQECFYIYALTMNQRTQYGLVACSSIDDYFNDVIKKHEYTRPEKEQDRIDHMKTVKAHVGPIFLTYPQNKNIDAIVAEIVATQHPIFNFTADDQIKHEGWMIQEQEKINQIKLIFEQQIPYTYIADGHHRTASAAKVGLQLKNENPNHNGNEHYNFFLSVLFPHHQLEILDYNRVIKDLNGLSAKDFLNLLEKKFEIKPTDIAHAKPQQAHQFGLYLEKQWYLLQAKENTWQNDPIGVLDISILSENILKPILNIQDQRTDKRIDFIGGIRGIQALQKNVDDGAFALAFAIYPVSLSQLMDIADSGKVMPPKSTWFEPKLRDGLFSHLF